MKTLSLIIASITFVGQLCSAQIDTVHIKFVKKTIGISTGLGRLLIHDPVVSPLNYSGLLIPLYGSFDSKKDKSVKSITVFFTHNKLRSNVSDNGVHEASGVYSWIQYKYFRNVISPSRHKSELEIGLSLDLTFASRNTRITNSYAPAELDLFSGLNFIGKYSHAINNKLQLSYELNYGIVNYVTSRDYGVNYPEGDPGTDEYGDEKPLKGDILFLNQFIDYKGILSLEYALTGKTDIMVSYLFRFYKYNRYKTYYPVKSGMSNLLVGFRFNL